MRPLRPSTYSPFLRRIFGNERLRELDETRQLYEHARYYQAGLLSERAEMVEILEEKIDELARELQRPLTKALHELLALEDQIWELPPPAFERMSMQEFVEYRNLLYAKQHFIANKDALLGRLYEGVANVVLGVANELPLLDDPSPFTIPFIYALPEPRLTVRKIWGTLGEHYENGLFRKVVAQFYRNTCIASGRNPDDPKSTKPIVFADESTLPLDKLVDTYLAGTPFHVVFKAPVPLRLTHQDRFNHWHVLAGSGAGKTTLIENLIRYDLACDDPPSIVLIDPHSDLVRKLVQSDLGIEDRLILIDPRDTKYPVALNPLAVNQERLSNYDEQTREQVTAGVNQTLGYLWNGLTNLALTGKQDVFFRYVTRLLLTLPEVEGRNATILDMLKLMIDPAPYARAIEALPEIPRDFFIRDFMSKGFEGTKEQIRYRIQAIIENPTMARLFTAPETKIDFFTEMNRGAVILVDTAKDFLKEGSSVFGKFIISLVLQAVLERAAIPEHQRKPTFIMIDEAASFFSSNIDDLLTEARKYKAGLLLAHQFLDQGTGSLRASLAANTGIKFASGLSAQDASAIARDMRTTPEFVLGQPKLQFAAYIRNVTPSAVSIPISPVRNTRQLTGEHCDQLIERNRKRVSLGPPQHDERGAARGEDTFVSDRGPGKRRSSYEARPTPPPANGDIAPEW